MKTFLIHISKKVKVQKYIRWTLLFFAWPFSTSAIEYEITGVNDTIKGNIEAHLINKNYECDAIQSTITQQHQDMLEQIRQAIQPFGYFNASIQLNSEQCDPLRLDIDKGPITTIKESIIETSATDDEQFNQLIKLHQLKPNKPLNQLKYQQLKNKLLDIASEKLYLDAHFTAQKITVFAEDNTANIELRLETGPRYKIGSTSIKTPSNFLDAALIERLVKIKSNSFITHSELYRMKQKLNSYGYFNQVLFELDEAQKFDGSVPLVITLTPAAKYDYSVGLGFSTDRGGQASFKYNNYRINTKGHQFSGQLNFSQINNELVSDYKIPSGSNPANKWFNIQLGYRDERTDNIESQTSKFGLSQTRIQNNRWQNINFIDVLHEKFDTGVEQGESLLLVPGVSWSLTDADNLTRPKKGYKLQSEFKGASEDLLSDASFAQLSLFGKYIHSLGDKSRILYRAQLAATASSDFDELPTTYRFFAGGDTSIRGFDFESVSPLNSSGDLAGGKHLAVASVEFEHQFANQWAWAAFTDFGDAFSDDFAFKYSVGTGVRWFSPIGPIRVDVGVPMDQEENDFRLHITIGPDL